MGTFPSSQCQKKSSFGFEKHGLHDSFQCLFSFSHDKGRAVSLKNQELQNIDDLKKVLTSRFLRFSFQSAMTINLQSFLVSKMCGEFMVCGGILRMAILGVCLEFLVSSKKFYTKVAFSPNLFFDTCQCNPCVLLHWMV